MDYLIDGIIIVFVLSCIILFYNAAKSYFEYKDAKSSKFLEVSVSGKKVNYYGKIGTDGQTSLKELSTPAEAEAHAEKQAAYRNGSMDFMKALGKVKKGHKEAKVKAEKKVAEKVAKKAVKKKAAKKAAKKKSVKKAVKQSAKKKATKKKAAKKTPARF